MNQYKCIAEDKIYSEEEMRDIFDLAKYNGYCGTFEDWITMEIQNKYIEVKIVPEYLKMQELLFCGVGNEVIYEKSHVIDEMKIKQRIGNDWNIDKRRARFDDLLKTDMPLYMILNY